MKRLVPGASVVVGACLLVAAACQRVPPRVAPGFTAANMAKLYPGISIADVRRELGPPAWEAQSSQPPSDLLAYATPGARSFLGDPVFDDHGFDCALWFEGGRLRSARIVDVARQLTCECNVQGCDPSWATACLAAAPPP